MTALKSDAILERMMTLHPKVIDLTLDRVHRLLALLGNPERAIPPAIHVAGTNGKGSTQAMIRAGLEQAGQKVHAYTSPHLARFHERIRLAGELIGEPALAALLDECVAKNGPDEITFFEITTCAAFLAFARTPADWTLLEVGLGGRLDATNVITPRLSIITPVSMDHESFLGDTLAKIASEKAGIIKRGIPVILGPQTAEGLEVMETTAARLGAPILAHGQHWTAWEDRGRLIYQDENGLLDLPLPNLLGPHQIQNAGAAITALRFLGHDEAACEAAVTRAEWPARMPARDTHLVCGMLNTKDVTGYMRPLAPRVTRLHAVSIPGEKDTLPAEATRDAALAAGMTATTAQSVADAIAAIAAENPEARILICGSLYLAGSILRENG